MNELIKSGFWMSIGAVLKDLYLHFRGRTFETRLLIDIRNSSTALGEKRILFVEVHLTNAGNGKLQARDIGSNDIVYSDEDECLRFSCSLQIKRLNTTKLAGETLLDWYKCPALETISGIPPEINLLDDYFVPEENKTVFWLEPSDIAQLSASLILLPGVYLLKVSFYGINSKNNYWSRLVSITIT